MDVKLDSLAQMNPAVADSLRRAKYREIGAMLTTVVGSWVEAGDTAEVSKYLEALHYYDRHAADSLRIYAFPICLKNKIENDRENARRAKEAAEAERRAARQYARERAEEERRVAKETSEARATFGRQLREGYLDAGLNIKVSVSGTNNTVLTLTFSLFNEVWTHRMQKEGDVEVWRALGFKRVNVRDGFGDFDVYWDLSE